VEASTPYPCPFGLVAKTRFLPFFAIQAIGLQIHAKSCIRPERYCPLLIALPGWLE
jgi:hypothetical protein